MKCQYCNSQNLIWDYKAGDVICADCGSVIEKIYERGFEGDEGEVVVVINPEKKIEKYKEQLKIIRKSREGVRKMVIYNGSLIREVSLNAMKLLENNERLLIIYDLIDSLPFFRTRSVRYKIAIGLYLYNKKEFERVKRSLGISEKYLRKLLLKIKMKGRRKIEKMIRERLSLS